MSTLPGELDDVDNLIKRGLNPFLQNTTLRMGLPGASAESIPQGHKRGQNKRLNRFKRLRAQGLSPSAVSCSLVPVHQLLWGSAAGRVTHSSRVLVLHIYEKFISSGDIFILDWQHETGLYKFQTGSLSQPIAVLLQRGNVAAMTPPITNPSAASGSFFLSLISTPRLHSRFP